MSFDYTLNYKIDFKNDTKHVCRLISKLQLLLQNLSNKKHNILELGLIKYSFDIILSKMNPYIWNNHVFHYNVKYIVFILCHLISSMVYKRWIYLYTDYIRQISRLWDAIMSKTRWDRPCSWIWLLHVETVTHNWL